MSSTLPGSKVESFPQILLSFSPAWWHHYYGMEFGSKYWQDPLARTERWRDQRRLLYEHPAPERAAALELPPLFEIYLRFGGRVAGPPVLDREFGTVDFFVLFDVEALTPRARRLFFG